MEKPNLPQPKGPAKAIRAYCLSCCLENSAEVRECAATECPLWPFRFGKNPFHSKAVRGEAEVDVETAT